MYRQFFWLAAFLNLSLCCAAQSDWQLIRNQDGIDIYTRRQQSEKFKEVRADFTLRATPEELVSVLQNISHHKDWSYGTKRTFLISRKGPDTLVYYSEVALPWPLENRDLVIQLTFRRDSVNHSLHIEARSISGILPPKAGLVRIPFSLATWEVSPLPKRSLKIEYTLRADPGGAIPAWLVNMGASVGPHNSFTKLREVIGNSHRSLYSVAK